MSICIDCHRIATYRGRCETHARENELRRGRRQARGLGRDHELLRAQTLSEETVCWICHLPETEDDPLQADHVRARAVGGENIRGNYRAAHRSCNASRGVGGHQGDPA